MQEPAPVQAPVTKAAEKPAALRENIFFRIGSAQIRTSEQAKVAALAEYLKANPSARIEIVGYADAATGSPALTLKLSRQRAAGVAAAVEQAGSAADRISAEGRGDTVQPFPGGEQNRVSICTAHQTGRGSVPCGGRFPAAAFFCPAFPPPSPLFTVYANVLPSAAHVCPVCRFAVRAPSGRHRAGRFLAPSAAFPACTSAVSFSRRPQDGKYKYLFRRNSPSGRHGLAGNLLFLHRFERLRRAGQHRFRAEGTRDRIQLKTFR